MIRSRGFVQFIGIRVQYLVLLAITILFRATLGLFKGKLFPYFLQSAF